MEKKLICFIGIDGSGKTTLAKKINQKFVNDNINSIYVYGRVKPLFSRFFMWIGRIIILNRDKNAVFNDYENYSTQKKKIFQRNIFSKLYIWIILFDHLIQIYYKIKLPLILNKTVVCDRYIYDTIITDISINTGYSLEQTINLIERTLKYIPTPDFIFYIDITEKVAYSRKDDIPHINYLIERKKFYDKIVNPFKIIRLDGSKSVEQLSNEAHEIIISGG